MTHCLYDSEAALPVNNRGKSPMQPVCKNRLVVGHGRLIAGAKADDLTAVHKALDEIGPLLACQFRNAELPCAQACYHDVNTVCLQFQEIVDRD